MAGTKPTRRDVLKYTGAGLMAGALPISAESPAATSHSDRAADPGRLPQGAVVIASANGVRTVQRAWEMVQKPEERPVHAAVMGVAIQEDDPNDTSVGYGGLPNEEGVVQLDAACMDGPKHNAGAVASIEGIRNPAQVAELVMDRTDHVLLVGEGAKRFALSYGFKEENLLTDKARKIWTYWREVRSDRDDWFSRSEEEVAKDPDLARIKRDWGTIHCSVLAPDGNLGCCTTTSGLSFKIPGRVGDSPLIGCGLYLDNEVGSAGATGRGEAAIHSGGSWLVVERMRNGDTPEEACLYAQKRVAEQARRQGLWDEAKNRPSFNLRFYAVRKDGLYGSASMHGKPGSKNFAVCDANGARREAGALLYEN